LYFIYEALSLHKKNSKHMNTVVCCARLC